MAGLSVESVSDPTRTFVVLDDLEGEIENSRAESCLPAQSRDESLETLQGTGIASIRDRANTSSNGTVGAWLRGVSRHRLINRQISPTSPGDRHAMSRPETKWTSTAGPATVFGQREMLSGESWLKVLSGTSRLITIGRENPWSRLKGSASWARKRTE